MNKIYKVVWSKVRNCYVVASELAKSHTKGSGARGLRRAAVTLGVTAALVGGISGSAWADVEINDTNKDSNGVNIIVTTYTIKGDGDVSVSASNDKKTITISATDTNTTYTAGNGISISGDNNTISVDAGDGLCFDNSGKVAVKLDGTSTGGSHLSLDATNGLSVIVNGAVEDNNTGLVTGGTVFTALQSYATKAGAELSNATLTNATISSGSIATDVTVGTGEGAPKLGSIATAAGKVDGIETKTNKITISEGTATFTGNVTGNVTGDVTGNVTATTLKVGSTPTDVTTALTTAGAVAETNAGFVTGGVVYSALGSALGDYVKTDATNITDLNNTQKQNWANALGNGTLDYTVATSDNLVKGSTVRDALENLSAGVIDASGATNADKLVKGFKVYDYLNGALLALGAGSTKIQIGESSSATGVNSIAIGVNSQAENADTIAIGSGAHAYYDDTDDGSIKNSIAIGAQAEAIGSAAIAIGYNAKSKNMSVVIGNEATTWNDTYRYYAPYAVAIGYGTKANIDFSTAIGPGAQAGAFGAVAIGYQANALTSSGTQLPIAIGGNAQATALNAIALGGGLNSGDGAVASAANTIAIGGGGTSSGNGASASEANAIAIGYNAKATIADTVALGSGAVTTRAAYATANYNAYLNEDGSKTPDTASTETKNAWRSTHGAVAVGNNATVTRQITGVAAGSADTDAVNVAQLKSATPMINDSHNYYVGSSTAVKVTDAVNAVDKALGKVATGSNYLTVYDASTTTPTGTFADNLTALDTALGAKIADDGTYNAISGSSTNSINANIRALDTAIGTLQTNTTAAIGTLADDGNYIKKSTTYNVSQNLVALDTAMGKVTSTNYAVASAGTAATSLAQSIDNIDAGLGAKITADGNYIKASSTNTINANIQALDTAIGDMSGFGSNNYAKSTTSAATNIKSLDTQVKTNANNIAALQSSTAASVGTIATDGNYIKKSDTNNVSQNLVALDTAIGDMSEFGSNNYAKSTASVATNIKSLDTQVKTNTDDIATLKNSISVQEDASGTKTTTIDGNLVIKEDDGTTKDVTAALTTEGEVAKQGEAGSEGYLKGETVYDYLNKGENGKEVKLAKESKQIAVGQGSVASGVESIAIGNETGGQRNEATGLQSIAIGFGNQVTGAHSGAIGDPTYIAADNSYAMGNSNNITATGARSFAIGNNNTISGSDTFVLGSNVNTNASNAVVLGNNSVGEDGAVSVGSVGNERQIKHVAPGTDVNDAVTVGQVAALAQNTTTVINRVDSKLNKVGAGAAALAALHPLDTDDKFTMGMGYGNYRNSHAAAIGMFYRPTDKVMISMSGTMGNGENMFNAGISFALDKGKGFSTSKAAMARKIAAQDEEIKSLKEENSKLEARLAAIEAKLGK